MKRFQIPSTIKSENVNCGVLANKKGPSEQKQTEQTFTCMYCKRGTKKKKIFNDGLLIISNGKIVLKDACSQLSIGAIRSSQNHLSSLSIGLSIEIGQYEAEVEESSETCFSDYVSLVSSTSSSAGSSDEGKMNLGGQQQSCSRGIQKQRIFKSLLNTKPLDQTISSKSRLLGPKNKVRLSPPSLLTSSSSTTSSSNVVSKLKSTPINANSVVDITLNKCLNSAPHNVHTIKRQRVSPYEIKDPLHAEQCDPGIKSLRRSLQPHQFEAVRFMWTNAIQIGKSGCILADSMGLGKTLSTIAFIYASIHHRLASNVVIVVPSSLISNWRNEFAKWLRHFLSPHVNSADRKVLVAVPGKGDNAKITTNQKNSKKQKKMNDKKKFKKSKVNNTSDTQNDDECCEEEEEGDEFQSIKILGGVEQAVCDFVSFNSPVLIISYEGFRKHSYQLNTSNLVNMIVCDEGHRLKCAQGSKTFTSLKNNPCQFKLLLTGTPVQNNLDELHSMVSFVKPGHLGSLSEFRSEFADAISTGRDRMCSADEKGYGQLKAVELRRLLEIVILRRTAEVLVKSLPPRNEIVLFCRLSNVQHDAYERIINGSGYGPGAKRDVADDDEEVHLAQNNKKDKDALSSIHALRMVCNHPALLLEHKKPPSSTSSSSLKRSTVTSIELNSCVKCENNLDLTISCKLQILHSLLSTLISSKSKPNSLLAKNVSNKEFIERIVIVSNFTSTLDLVSTLALSNHWKCLRIDGTTPPDQRQSLVDRFNRQSETDDAFIFLLSSHAGGVGLNLVGASRLVLFDTDWNPAVDQQTMGRIWRQGQTRPVFIYRLLSTGTLEEKMFQRQIAKGELSCAVQVTSNFSSTETNHEYEAQNDEINDDIRHFNQEDIRDLFHYRPQVPFCDTFECMRGRWCEDSQEKALNQDKVLGVALNKLKVAAPACDVSFIRLLTPET